MIGTALRCWLFSLVALLVASAGLSAVSAGSPVTSLVQLGTAAGVLSVFAAVCGLLLTDRDDRTLPRNLLLGGMVPLVVGTVTAVLAGSSAGPTAGFYALLPWLAGVLAAGLLGPWLPTLRLRRPWRRAEDRTSYYDL